MNRWVAGRETRILKGAKAIAEVFGVSKVRVRQWYAQGAPIVLDGSYRAEVWELWCWHRDTCDKKRACHTIPGDRPQPADPVSAG